MQGEIVGINPLRSIIVVQTSAGFTVAEVLGDIEPLNLDDLVSGPLDRQEIQTDVPPQFWTRF